MNKEFLKSLIDEGQKLLNTAFEQDDGITVVHSGYARNYNSHTPIINTYVDTDFFNKWYEKVKIFLKNNNFEDSIVLPNAFFKNYDIAKEQIAKLEAMYETISFITENNQSNSTWEYLTTNTIKLFEEEHFQEAVLDAFKLVEIQVRQKGNYSATDFGVQLMRKAFNIDDGVLTNSSLPKGEKQAQSDLFAGAIGFL